MSKICYIIFIFSYIYGWFATGLLMKLLISPYFCNIWYLGSLTQIKAAISDVCLLSLKSHLFYLNQWDRFIIHRLLVDRRYSLVQSCLVRLSERAFPNRFSYNSILLLKKFMRERLLSFCDERRPTVWNKIQRRSGGNNELLLLFLGKTTSHVFYHSYLCDKELFFLKSYKVYNWVIISFLIFATVSTHWPAFLFALSHSCAYACVSAKLSRPLRAAPFKVTPSRSPLCASSTKISWRISFI